MHKKIFQFVSYISNVDVLLFYGDSPVSSIIGFNPRVEDTDLVTKSLARFSRHAPDRVRTDLHLQLSYQIHEIRWSVYTKSLYILYSNIWI